MQEYLLKNLTEIIMSADTPRFTRRLDQDQCILPSELMEKTIEDIETMQLGTPEERGRVVAHIRHAMSNNFNSVGISKDLFERVTMQPGEREKAT